MRQHRVGSRLFMALVFLFLYAPILLLVVFSFNAGGSNVVWEGFSLRWYQELFQDRRMMEAVYTTLLVSVLATLISTVAGTFASVGLYGMKKRWREPILSVNNIPIMNADIVTGVALCIFFVAVIGWLERLCHLPGGEFPPHPPPDWRWASAPCCWPTCPSTSPTSF